MNDRSVFGLNRALDALKIVPNFDCPKIGVTTWTI